MSISTDEEPDPLDGIAVAENTKQKKKTKKKTKTRTTPTMTKTTINTTNNTSITTAPKASASRLSKFSQNLLKPGYLESRRGLIVEAPEIPLSDYCLQDFGRSARAILIKDADDGCESDSDGEASVSRRGSQSPPPAPQTPKAKAVRVKVSNLNFKTTKER